MWLQCKVLGNLERLVMHFSWVAGGFKGSYRYFYICSLPGKRNWCFWTLVLQKTLESPLDCMIKPVNPKGSQPWIFIGRTDAEAPILWSPDVNSRLTGKDPDAGKGWRQKEKGAAEDEMVRYHNQLKGHELEQTLGDGEGQGSLACCSPWGHKQSDTTTQRQQGKTKNLSLK